MQNGSHKLPKKAKLKSRKSIETLMNNGNVVKAYPILFAYTLHESDSPEIKVMFSVSKKKQKLAVKRNRIKRLLRESYRLNNLSLQEFVQTKRRSMHLMVLQVTGEEYTLQLVEKKVKKAIKKLMEAE